MWLGTCLWALESCAREFVSKVFEYADPHFEKVTDSIVQMVTQEVTAETQMQ